MLHQRELARLVREHAPIAAAIAGAVRALNGEPGDAASFDRLHELLEAQAYRLAFWRVASDEINYRRFFDINDLAALRMENEAAFEATHRKIFDLAARGQGRCAAHRSRRWPVRSRRRTAGGCRTASALRGPAAFELPADSQRWPLYVITEKIIASFEDMPQIWGVYGTTGYRFANVLNGLFVDTAAEHRVTRTYHSFIGDDAAFDEIAVRGKHLILRNALASELMVLANRLARIAHANRDTRDYTLNTLRQALAEVIARFPVYRTYIADKIADTDRRYIEWAVGVAQASQPRRRREHFRFHQIGAARRAPRGGRAARRRGDAHVRDENSSR